MNWVIVTIYVPALLVSSVLIFMQLRRPTSLPAVPRCCGGTRSVEASTEPPRDLDLFLRIESGPLELYVRPAGEHGLPRELDVDLARMRRHRLQAWWDGCPYLP